MLSSSWRVVAAQGELQRRVRSCALRALATKASGNKKQSGRGPPQAMQPHIPERDKELDLILASLDAPMRVEPEISPEEKQRRYRVGRKYVIGCFRQHNDLNHNLACKIQLKKHAVKMLPRDSRIKEEALKIEFDGPPLDRHIAKWTPPIPGFDPSMFVKEE